MKQKLLSIVVILALSNTALAQEKAFDKGNFIVSLGYGAPNTTKSLYSSYKTTYDNFKSSGIGPLHAKVEYGIGTNFGIGLSVNYVNSGATFEDLTFGETYDISRSSLKVNFRGNYHFGKSEKVDPYLGVGIGWGSTTTNVVTNDQFFDFNRKNPFPLGFEGTFGLRYYVIPSVAVYSEIGLAKSIVQLGGCFRFGGSSE